MGILLACYVCEAQEARSGYQIPWNLICKPLWAKSTSCPLTSHTYVDMHTHMPQNKESYRAGERAQPLRALATLAEQPGLVLNTHTAAHKHLGLQFLLAPRTPRPTTLINSSRQTHSTKTIYAS